MGERITQTDQNLPKFVMTGEKMTIDKSKVTIIIPVFNEEKYIEGVINSLINQDWKGKIEIIVVDGNSTDNTCKIIRQMMNKLPKRISIKILNNPQRFIPISLNIACKQATSDIIIRIDGHTFAPSNFISEIVNALEEIDYNGIVGGRLLIQSASSSAVAKAIEIGVSHPLGVGNALYRTTKDRPLSRFIEVDTVPFGAFKKELWEQLGGFDENMHSNEDYDFNFRAKKLGYKIVMATRIVLKYVPRSTIIQLWKQYFRYGFWVSRFFIKHKTVPAVRKIIPLIFLFSLILTFLLNKNAFFLLVVFYGSFIFIISIYEGLLKRRNLSIVFFLLLTFVTLHFAYAFGNITGFLSKMFRNFTKKGEIL